MSGNRPVELTHSSYGKLDASGIPGGPAPMGCRAVRFVPTRICCCPGRIPPTRRFRDTVRSLQTLSSGDDRRARVLRRVEAHTDPRSDVETTCPLCVPDGLKFRADLAVVQDSKTEMLVQRPIPRHPDRKGHVGVGGERDDVAAGLQGPHTDAVDERTTRTHALVLRIDTDLLDVHVAVDVGDHHVPNQLPRSADGNPASAIRRMAPQLIEGRRLVVREHRQPDFSESDSGEPLDILHSTGVKLAGGSHDKHAASIAAGVPARRPSPAMRATRTSEQCMWIGGI